MQMSVKLVQGQLVDGLPGVGFVHNGLVICDPYVSDCGRFPVDPKDYGVSIEEANFLLALNKTVVKSAQDTLDDVPSKIRESLNVSLSRLYKDFAQSESLVIHLRVQAVECMREAFSAT